MDSFMKLITYEFENFFSIKSIYICILPILLLAFLGACDFFTSSTQQPPNGIILISLDTLGLTILVIWLSPQYESTY